jgi:hypothetical protein
LRSDRRAGKCGCGTTGSGDRVDWHGDTHRPLQGEVGTGLKDRITDVVSVHTALTTLGFLDGDSRGTRGGQMGGEQAGGGETRGARMRRGQIRGGMINEALNSAIRRFQVNRKQRPDGIRPPKRPNPESTRRCSAECV